MRHVALLRGINLGSRNRIAMPALRAVLTDAGFADVSTYVQSGNVVLTSGKTPDRLERECERLIVDAFGLDIAVVVRTRDELAAIVDANPLGEVADNPKRYQVTFLRAEPAPGAIEELAELAAETEQLVAIGRELYVWHPEGIARSRLSARLAGRGLGVTATARNWTTVTKLLALARGSAE